MNRECISIRWCESGDRPVQEMKQIPGVFRSGRLPPEIDQDGLLARTADHAEGPNARLLELQVRALLGEGFLDRAAGLLAAHPAEGAGALGPDDGVAGRQPFRNQYQTKSRSMTVLRLSAFACSMAWSHRRRTSSDNLGATFAAVFIPETLRI